MAASLGLTASLGIAQALACTPGDQACPVLLTMKAGASVIEATGTVSRERPIFYFKFVAEAGQTIMVHTTGGGLKSGPGIPIAGPSGAQDALDEDTPYTAPVSGPYVIELHANTMSDGPFGRFRLRLRIK